MIDTGANPSVIDTSLAKALRLKVTQDRGQISGVGSKQVAAASVSLTSLAIAGNPIKPIEAIATDLGSLSAHYGRPLQAVLGYSFLKDKIALIDYPRRQLHLLPSAVQAASTVSSCRIEWSARMTLLAGDDWPLVPGFRIGASSATATLDTGSSGFVTLYPKSLGLRGVRKALIAKGRSTSTGFRGNASLEKYVISAPIGFGPFAYQRGQRIRLSGDPLAKVNANVGNRFFAGLHIKMLLDYPKKSLMFWAGCTR